LGNPTNYTDPSAHVLCFGGIDPKTGLCRGTNLLLSFLPPGLATVAQAGQGTSIGPGAGVAAFIIGGFICATAVYDVLTEGKVTTWEQLLALPVSQPEPKPRGTVVPFPPLPPLPQPEVTATPEPQYIYRFGSGPKAVQLHKDSDWMTGLSFLDYNVGTNLKFSVPNLRGHGYIVRPDAGMLITNLWTGDPYVEPNSGESGFRFPAGHVTVYYPDKQYWDEWHQADVANFGRPQISAQALALFNLSEH
jgi:hypothetical protein